MPDEFLKLSKEDRLEALGVAATASGRPAHLLEKDTWVVWVLDVLFKSSFGKNLVFKGGTSLSKAYGAINRFSEDIDVTYDIRAFAPDLVKDYPDALPPNRSQAKKWTEKIRERLAKWVESDALTVVQEQIKSSGLNAKAYAEGHDLIVEYEPVATGTGYVSPRVKVEFGARSTGEPFEVCDINCDAADHLPNLVFPTASPRVMLVDRTFWEKATAAHVFCLQHKLKDTRYARHWYDLVELHKEGLAKAAIANKSVAGEVADHKTWFFRETDSQHHPIDYGAAVSGSLKLVPEGEAYKTLEDDYSKMVEDGLILGEPPSFQSIIDQCRELERLANAARKEPTSTQ